MNMLITRWTVTSLAFVLGSTFFFACNQKNQNGVSAAGSPTQIAEQAVYRCSMHPQVRSDEPGECPICHMKLQKSEASEPEEGTTKSSAQKNEKRIKFYRNPMDPSVHSDKPTKDNMGMDYVPVYEEENAPASDSDKALSRSAVSLTPEKLKLSGTSLVTVEKRDLIANIRVPGRVLGGTRVSFQVFEQDIPLLRVGMEFEAESASFPGETFRGKITSVDSILDPMTRTVRVDGSLDRTGKIALRTEASIIGVLKTKLPGVLVIPEGAVLHAGSKELVYVYGADRRFHPREVSLGVKAEHFYEIKNGIEASEQVSAGPNFLLDSESRIESSE